MSLIAMAYQSSKCDLLQGLLLYLRMIVLVSNTGQNASTPCLGVNRFGGFYNMTPITQLFFGSACLTEEFTDIYIRKNQLQTVGLTLVSSIST
jgi:hypothetical protein